MKIGDYQIGWFDLILLGLLVFGVIRGRKRGMTEEFPNLIQWVIILVGGALIHRPLGNLFAEWTGLGRLFLYVFVYLLWAFFVKLTIVWIVRSLGDKAAISDFWGAAEYPLGMVTACIRMVLTVMFCLALLNARNYTNQELVSMAKYQQDNYGSISFPTLGEIQLEVFKHSLTGKLVKEHLEFALVESTRPKPRHTAPVEKPFWET